MTTIQKKTFFGRAALVCAPIIWGFSFVLVKDISDAVGVPFLLCIRFFAAAALLSIIYARRLRKINKEYLIRGAVIGALLFVSYLLQTYGIRYTTPGKNAFLTGIYVVFVPFIHWFTAHKKPTFFNLFAAAMSISGIALVALNGGGLSQINPGDILTLCGGFTFALHIVCVNRFAEENDPVLLTILQFFFAGILGALGYALTGEGVLRPLGATDLLTVVYLSLMCTAVALLLQTVGQKYTPPALTSVILCMESAIGFLFSAFMGREQLHSRLIIGFLLIFTATLICEAKLPVHSKKGTST